MEREKEREKVTGGVGLSGREFAHHPALHGEANKNSARLGM